jgi:hypothetical protein
MPMADVDWTGRSKIMGGNIHAGMHGLDVPFGANYVPFGVNHVPFGATLPPSAPLTPSVWTSTPPMRTTRPCRTTWRIWSRRKTWMP